MSSPLDHSNICRICTANQRPNRSSANHGASCLICGILLHTPAEVRRAIKTAVEFPEGYIINGALATMYQESSNHTLICNDCVERHPERVATIQRKRRSGGLSEAYAALISEASPVPSADDRRAQGKTSRAISDYRRRLDYPTIESVETALAWLECRGLQGTGKNIQVVLGVEYMDKIRHYIKMLRRAEVPVG